MKGAPKKIVPSILSVSVACALLAATPLHAQCDLTPTTVQPGGSDGPVRAISFSASGDAIVAGSFTNIDGVAVSNIARFDGTTVHAMGAGLTGQPPWAILPPNPTANALTHLANGDLVVAGQFVTAGSTVCNSIARWDGSNWSAMGTGVDYYVWSLHTMRNGDLIVGGAFTTIDGVLVNGIARWDGSSWSSMGGAAGGLFGPAIFDMASAPNGDLVVVGSFTSIGGVPANGVARWNGSSWSAFGTKLIGPLLGDGDVEVLANGDVVVSGVLALNGVTTFLALWDGSNWTSIDSAGELWPRALLAMPNGDLITHGQYQVGGAPTPLGRFDGSSWSPLAGVADGPVLTIARDAHGRLMFGGTFTTAAGVAEPNLVQLQTTCLADVHAFGPWCSSSGGGNDLAAMTTPWVGATFRAEATGLPNFGFAAAITGFGSTCEFLNSLLPLADSQCFLLVEPDFFELGVIQSGMFETEIEVPNIPSAAGLTVFHQVLPFETTAQGAWVTTTATNALELTLGHF